MSPASPISQSPETFRRVSLSDNVVKALGIGLLFSLVIFTLLAAIETDVIKGVIGGSATAGAMVVGFLVHCFCSKERVIKIQEGTHQIQTEQVTLKKVTQVSFQAIAVLVLGLLCSLVAFSLLDHFGYDLTQAIIGGSAIAAIAVSAFLIYHSYSKEKKIELAFIKNKLEAIETYSFDISISDFLKRYLNLSYAANYNSTADVIVTNPQNNDFDVVNQNDTIYDPTTQVWDITESSIRVRFKNSN